MNPLQEFALKIGIPGCIIAGAVILYALLQIIGELVELKGKIVPEFMKIRKFFNRKRDEKIAQKELLESLQTSLSEINSHYSKDNITKRDKWMEWVNQRAAVYDAALNELTSMKDVLKTNNQLTLDLYINTNRHRILDFASRVVHEDSIVSREEFNRIFKVYDEYESTLEKHNLKNGEVDIAIRVIRESYADRLKENNFLEDKRGYL